jgi:hypothetical protein
MWQAARRETPRQALPNANCGLCGWIVEVATECELEEIDHGRRLCHVLRHFSGEVSAAKPWTCQAWADSILLVSLATIASKWPVD